jgi:hypothetical protein
MTPTRTARLGCALAALLRAASPAAQEARPEMVEMEVAAVVPLEGQAAVLVLGQKGTGTVLPVFIGQPEGSAIEQGMRRVPTPRPLTHDLLGEAIAALGARVQRVDIDAFRGSTFHAKVRLAQGARALTLDARPSDAVALAVRVRAPIYADSRIVKGQGVSREELDRLRRRQRDAQGSPGDPGTRL